MSSFDLFKLCVVSSPHFPGGKVFPLKAMLHENVASSITDREAPLVYFDEDWQAEVVKMFEFTRQNPEVALDLIQNLRLAYYFEFVMGLDLTETAGRHVLFMLGLCRTFCPPSFEQQMVFWLASPLITGRVRTRMEFVQRVVAMEIPLIPASLEFPWAHESRMTLKPPNLHFGCPTDPKLLLDELKRANEAEYASNTKPPHYIDVSERRARVEEETQRPAVLSDYPAWAGGWVGNMNNAWSRLVPSDSSIATSSQAAPASPLARIPQSPEGFAPASPLADSPTSPRAASPPPARAGSKRKSAPGLSVNKKYKK